MSRAPLLAVAVAVAAPACTPGTLLDPVSENDELTQDLATPLAPGQNRIKVRFLQQNGERSSRTIVYYLGEEDS